jgi:aryl-alcohol dehydrogenase-like predicted oxidoreductase
VPRRVPTARTASGLPSGPQRDHNLRSLTGLKTPGWLDPKELRIGLGCMRLSTDPGRDEQRAVETIGAAVDAGVTVFDTARAYGHDERELGHNERLLARALRGAGGDATARIVTKGGMRRVGTAWVADGRAKAIRADCEASLAVLDGLPIDLYLIHAPDPRTPWRTSLRALARIADEGLVGRVGVSNVNRRQLDEALELAPIAAVEVALGPLEDRALRGGVVDRCLEARATPIAHSPLGGPRRAASLARRPELAAIADRLEATPWEVALAWLLGLAPGIVAIPGARRPETARSAAHAASLALTDDDRTLLDDAFGRRPVRTTPSAARTDTDVVLVMGIPGAGKSRLTADHVARGYVRLNRDERGGTLRALSDELDAALAWGASRVVLDNTYLTRAARRDVLDAAGRHAADVRLVWIDTPLAQAQVNLVERLLDRFGHLPSPEELREHARREPGLVAPTSQMRALRELEPPVDDEGFASIERIPFARTPSSSRGAVFVAAAALGEPRWEEAVRQADPAAPHLVFDWRPDGSVDDLADPVARLSALVESVAAGVCPHGGGAPTCWCRPPLPGLLLAFARTHGADPARSTLIGTSAAHRTLATTLGARYVEP